MSSESFATDNRNDAGSCPVAKADPMSEKKIRRVSFATEGSSHIPSLPTVRRSTSLLTGSFAIDGSTKNVASLIEEHEQCIGITKSGISVIPDFNDVETGLNFQDCMEEEIEDDNKYSDPYDSEKEEFEECGCWDNSSDSAQSTGATDATLNDCNEKVEKKECGTMNTGSLSTEANTTSTMNRIKMLESISVDHRMQMVRKKSDQSLDLKNLHEESLGQGDGLLGSTVSAQALGSFRGNPASEMNSSKTSFPDVLEKFDAARITTERAEAFFFNNGMTFALGGLFLSMNIVVAAHAAYQFLECGGFVTDNDILRVTMPIARVGGRLVTFNCAWLLITACKYSWTMIRTKLVPIIPIGFPIDDIMPKYHRFVALWIIFFGNIVHMLPQVANYATGALKIDDGRKIWTFGNGIATRQLLITGILLTLIFTMFFLTTLESFRRTTAGFRWFWCFHMGGIALAYPLLIIHGTFKGNPIFLYTALTPLMVYVFDVTMRKSKVKTTKVVEWKVHSGGGQQITELVVECPPYFVYKPGQYVELKFNCISTTEWHPFTIASSPTSDIRVYNGKQVRVLIFFIKAAGRWTEALFNFASAFDLSKASKSMDISIRGPHGAPAMNFFEYKHILVVGSGVGVTPLLSVWQYMLDRGRSKLIQKENSHAMSCATRQTDAYPIDSIDIESGRTSIMSEKGDSGIQRMFSNTIYIMESLTASVFLYGFFLSLETTMAVTFIYRRYTLVAFMEILFASISLLVHIATMTMGVLAARRVNGEGGSKRFGFKTLIESGIILVDVVNLWLSLLVVKNDRNVFLGPNLATKENSNPALLIVAMGGITVFLYAVRIFHTFYAVLKPPRGKQGQKNKVSSIQGIFINRHYHGMRFCIEQLLQQPLQGQFSSEAFSLKVYGTQEQDEPNSKHFSKHQDDDWRTFREGRPEWESILWEAIEKARRSDPDGASIGVFFCGSPGIAKCLRSTADKINAKLQYAAKRTRTNGSRNLANFKIVIHVENY